MSVATGSTITRPATLTNNSNEIANIVTWKSDFQSSGDNGIPFFLRTGNEPDFVRRSELVFLDQWLSTWITIDTPSFTIAPWESKTINFTIDVPADATPGGHYGAVFFKNQNSENSPTWNVSINVDYWVLILVNVEWDVIIDGEVGGIQISGGWRANPESNPQEEESEQETQTGQNLDNWNNEWGSNPQESGQTSTNTPPPPSWEQGWLGITSPQNSYDDCPLWDFTNSNFDWRCIDLPFAWKDNTSPSENPPPDNNTEEKNNEENTSEIEEEEDFTVEIEIPFKNTGTTHVKPTGKVILEDSEGNQLKQIGREVVINDLWIIVWENIVDYIPINDTRGNVLPKTRRVFNTEWKWFPYKAYTPEGELIVKYWDPGEYYTRQNKEEAGFLMFWERVCEARKHKTITALIDVLYTNEKWEEIEFNAAEEFDIEYTEQYIGLNPYVIVPLILLGLLGFGYLFFFWILAGKKKKRCKNCDTHIRKNWKICPKCKKKIK